MPKVKPLYHSVPFRTKTMDNEHILAQNDQLHWSTTVYVRGAGICKTWSVLQRAGEKGKTYRVVELFEMEIHLAVRPRAPNGGLRYGE